MKIKAPVLLAVILFLFCSCAYNNALEYALSSAGSNRPELETVLEHYRNIDANPDKLRAAEFLIENLPAHYSYSGTDIYEYYDYASSILADSTLTPEQQYDSLLFITQVKYCDLPSHTIPDVQIIKADYLIYTIDRSYFQWTTCPWSSQLTFDDYLEWLLPYKAIELQEFDSWRDTLFYYFGNGFCDPFKNDVEYNSSMKKVDTLMYEANKGLHCYEIPNRTSLPLLSAQLQVHQTFGTISDYVLTSVLLMRSAGVPAVLDETPVGPRGTAATKWFAIMADRGEQLASERALFTKVEGSFYPYERGPKVYRNTFAINKERQKYLKEANYHYPFELSKKDVTSQYFLTSDVKIPIKWSIRKKLRDEYVYIASSVRCAESPWQIVDFGTIKRGKACFHDMGREVLYTVMGYDGDKLIEISDPFILHKDQTIEYVSADTINSGNLNRWKNESL